MISITTLLILGMVVLAWRSRAWLLLALALAVGVTLTGPVADGLKSGVHGVQTGATTVDQVVRDTQKK